MGNEGLLSPNIPPIFSATPALPVEASWVWNRDRPASGPVRGRAYDMVMGYKSQYDRLRQTGRFIERVAA
jgi:hypothetical protein